MNSLRVLFLLIIEYLIILGALIAGFIISVCIGEIVIKGKKDLINWLFVIVLWSIVFIIALVKERRERKGE